MTTGLFPSRQGNAGPRKGYMPKNRRRPSDLLERFAEALSEHGDIRRAAEEAGTTYGGGRQLFLRLRKGLGGQAI